MPGLNNQLKIMSRKVKAESTSSDESEVERQPRNVFNAQSSTTCDQTTSSDESEEEPIVDIKAAKERFNKAQKNLKIMDEMLLRLQVEMNHVEVQWLQLSNIAKSQPSNSPEQKKIDPHFKDAEDINATTLDLAIVPKEYRDSYYDSDLE